MIVLRIVRPAAAAGATIPVPPGPPLRIGRLPDNEVCVRGMAVSKRHATIEAVDGSRARVRDLGSAGGFWVKRATGETDRGLADSDGLLVGPGDRILLGDAELEVIET